MDAVKVYVGTSPGGEDYEAEAVLAYTLRKYASMDVSIVWMRQAKEGPYSGWKSARGRTPFSHHRWSIPAMCGYEGRAIYVDTDFCVMADIAELWQQDIPGVFLAKKSRKPGGKIKTCCILFDCERAKAHISDIPALKRMDDPQGFYGKYFQQHGELVDNFDGDWNAIDLGGYENLHDPRVKAVHYSRMEHQVHLPHAMARLKKQGRSHWYTGPVFEHPRKDLQAHFDAMLIEAQEAGYTYESFGYETGIEITRRAFTYKFHKGTTPIGVSA